MWRSHVAGVRDGFRDRAAAVAGRDSGQAVMVVVRVFDTFAGRDRFFGRAGCLERRTQENSDETPELLIN
ncbi:hypothetical protein GC176_09420 [bacterium]|nr:hypothetical protein [bacterium]